MPAITNDWLAPLSEEFHKPYYKKLYETVVEEYNRGTVFPPADDIFNAFHLTPFIRCEGCDYRTGSVS